MPSWAAQELRYARLGDARLNRRLIRLVEDWAAQPTASVPQACGNWAATKGAYRFWSSSSVTPEAIRAAHCQRTVERLQGHALILVIQDTTDLNFTPHRSTQGLGPLDPVSQQGLKVHSALAVSSQGVPLGLIYQEVWARDPEAVGKHHRRRQRETQDQESQRWLTAQAATQQAVPPGIAVITIADREADIYDLLAAPRRPGDHLLIRAAHHRRVSHEAGYLWEAVRRSPVQGQVTMALRRKDDRPPRQATLTVRSTTLAIHPPRPHRRRASLHPIPVHVILVEEEHPPSGVPPVCWLLLTTLPVTTFAEAVQWVQWYSERWLVERDHFVLKSGCRLEELQLEEAERIRRALATYGIVAWRLLWLTYEARQNPHAPCEIALETHEWQALYGTIHKTSIPPAAPPTLHEAVRWIAQLGGFLGRKHDGEPGVKTIWRGLRRLHDITATWQLLHSPPPAFVDT